MSAISKKLRRLQGGRVGYWCPGCDECHGINVDEGTRPRWEWDGNGDAPSFSPSINVSCDWGDPPEREVCHHFVKSGMIQFLDDCTHAMKGQTVPLPDWPESLDW